MTRCSDTPDYTYKWMNFDGRDCLKINDYMIDLPDLPLPDNARYIGPLLQGLYGRHRPCTLSRRLQCLLMCTLEHNPDFFNNVKRRGWYYIPQPEKNQRKPRKIPKKRGRKPKAREPQPVGECD